MRGKKTWGKEIEEYMGLLGHGLITWTTVILETKLKSALDNQTSWYSSISCIDKQSDICVICVESCIVRWGCGCKFWCWSSPLVAWVNYLLWDSMLSVADANVVPTKLNISCDVPIICGAVIGYNDRRKLPCCNLHSIYCTSIIFFLWNINGILLGEPAYWKQEADSVSKK